MITTQPFGHTGHESTRTIFGGAALWELNPEVAEQTLELLLQYGINHIDTAANYGESELNIGPWMPTHRQKFFLATKTQERSYQAAYDQIRRSLERLQTDHVDLLQLHFLVDPQEWETAMGDDGALKAAIQARDEGLIRFIGVTGHGLTAPAMHLRSLERFDFDSVLLVYNYVMMQIPQYAADFQRLLATCQKREVAVQTIKAIARRPWGDRPHTKATWYEPLTEQEAIDHAVHWVLSCPGIFLNTVGDTTLLPKVLDAAARYQEAPSNEVMQADVTRLGMASIFPNG